ncbi:hypothetical protein VTH82DRAFT_3882 [Thermothelomyces myriococcoides]
MKLLLSSSDGSPNCRERGRGRERGRAFRLPRPCHDSGKPCIGKPSHMLDEVAPHAYHDALAGLHTCGCDIRQISNVGFLRRRRGGATNRLKTFPYA